ncbi:ATP-dependent rRNA helicase RRP3 [Coprinopsis cinerea okayama7|uniref:ATP-dependent rRNA helicase RRP3 n=1 Tax=Coprinopsis cinerea (strain Okayama-7 / 130 / ATCC MYA-4618 / FGSC 9003) TaxID=240176 RepID=A8NXB6_COPC7|nr:ATP-dependent rRNA helicase RRP3 [Coprinopsis cinerea okayama7\|eukprot:XP_001837121.2 ATP-dependent rRNA helicase RRP3 [Coprinopsis cinerea okayama7\
MATRTKKRHLTTDDLLRLQEEPSLKRIKTTSFTTTRQTDQYSDLEATSSDDDAETGNSKKGEKALQRDEESDDEEAETSDSDEEDSPSSSENGESIPVVDRFGSAGKLSRSGAQSSEEVKRLSAVTSFSSLGVSNVLQTALSSMSITSPTEVQAACIPPILAGNAKTGSGKTIAFALPILQKLLVDPYGIFALVLTPTRELAFQIAEQFAVLGGSVNVRTSVIVGGMDMVSQALELDQRPHIIIATPGRIVDHLKSTKGNWDLSRIKFLVLDEADRLLTETFTPELSYLFNVLPKNRQTCLFTATMTLSIENLADAPPRPGKSKPFVHRVKEADPSIETVSTLKQHYILVPSHVREVYLFRILCHPPESTIHLRRAPPEPAKNLQKPKVGKAKKSKSRTAEEEIEQPPPTIIFCGRASTAAYLTALLKALGIRSTALHSRLTQRERLSSLSLFRASVVPVLVSTDVAARGLDIEDVAMVVNWDLPAEPEEYTHRVGRTARAGKGGVAISFVTERDEERVLRIEQRIKTRLEEMDLPEEKVLEKLNTVSTAKRLAKMELHDSDFGKREEIYKIKNAKRGRKETDAGSTESLDAAEQIPTR